MEKIVNIIVSRIHPTYFKGLLNSEIGNIFYPMPVFYDGVKYEVIGCKNFDGVSADLVIRETITNGR